MAKIDKLKDLKLNRPLRILHISSAKTWRGGENQMKLLLEGLPPTCQNYVFCPVQSALSQRINQESTTIITYKKRGGISLSITSKIKEICSDQIINFIHVHDSHAHNYAISAAILGCTLPILVTRRVDFSPSKVSIMKYNHSSVKKVICVSKHIQNILQGNGVKADKLTTIRSGINVVNKLGLNLKEELSISKSKIIVGFVGAFVDHKDPLTFLKMAKSLLGERKDIHFLMAGQDGVLRSEMKKYIKENGLSEHITVLGFRKDSADIWATINVLVITSKMEGLGTVALEAFLHRVPVISTNAGGLTEIVKHEYNGMVSQIGNYLNLKEQVKKVIDNRALSNRLTLQASIDLKQFDANQMIESYFNLYCEL